MDVVSAIEQVGSEQGKTRVPVMISDSGAGIDASDLGSIFDAHFRGSGARESGHGIGLNLVGRIANRCDWPLNLLSEPGSGTEVKITFPNAEITEPGLISEDDQIPSRDLDNVTTLRSRRTG